MSEVELEAEPEAAAVLFGDRVDLARSYTNELGRRGEELGLIGPLELPRIWTRHIINSALVAPLLHSGRSAMWEAAPDSPAWCSPSPVKMFT